MKPVVASVAAALLLAACGGDDLSTGGGGGGQKPEGKYSATIVRTDMGIPHITANSYGDLGFGQGYAFAEDNLCVMMEDFITIRGERAKFFGVGGDKGSYLIEPNGSSADNISSDFFWKFVADDAAWQRTRDRTKADFKELVTGYTAGFNQYMAELKGGQHAGRHAACAQEAFLQPITEADMYRRFVRLSILASSSVFVNEIANTQPPSVDTATGLLAPVLGQLPEPLRDLINTILEPIQGILSMLQQALGMAPSLPGVSELSPEAVAQKTAALQSDPGGLGRLKEHDKFGSNMYAFGKDVSATGQPIVFGNPHFPWRGTERLYISHSTIPGELDIMGSSLYGVPAVLIGFNKAVAWSHTVSTAYRFTLYELVLNPSNPTQYFYDGEMRDMTAVPLTIEVKQADGSLTTQNRTLYKSHYGPMFTLGAAGVPILTWSPAVAYTIRDANLENDRLINQFGEWNRAKSLDEFISLHGTELGVPWVNTVASGPNGKAYYGDVTVVPNVPDAKLAPPSPCAATLVGQVVAQVAPGLPVMAGSLSQCEWDTDADAPVPGIFGPGNLPKIQRDDYVHNCNDSYWLTNPRERLTGFARIIGDENAPRTLRTRLCILQAERAIRGDGLSGPDGAMGGKLAVNNTDFFNPNKVMATNLQEVVLRSDIYSWEIAKDGVIGTAPGAICANPLVAQNANAARACQVLAGWDGRDNVDAAAKPGSHIWREFWRKLNAPPSISLGGMTLTLPLGLPLPANPLPIPLPTDIFATGFSATGDSAFTTPRGLNPTNPQAIQAFIAAADEIVAAGVALDAPLSALQISGVNRGPGNAPIPIPGGEGGTGAFTIISTQGAADSLLQSGKYNVVYGNSYIHTVTWDSAGNPLAEGFVTYSQSTDPASPHFSDFTQAYGKKQWQRFPFAPADVQAQKKSEKVVAN